MVFHGGEHEASAVKLTGVVRLTTPESISISKPKVRLEGKRKISWWYMGGLSAGEVTDKRSFWTQEQKLGVESAHKIKAGVIEWPFEFELSPSMPESVEGLRETFIAYHLHASVSRPGWNTKDLLAQEHIRIVRTLGQDSMEMTRSRVNADIWANKIAYSISIPTDAIVFGTSITADVELSPIKKGLQLGKVELKLQETVVKRIQISELPDARGDRAKSEESEVASIDMEFPEHSRVMYDDETIDNPTMADEMYKFKATLPLPKSLNECRQDVDSHQINVTHRFKLMVNIHNPEGHISQLVCRLPVKLFISPNLPVDESNEVRPTANGVSHEALNNTETTIVAPPEYGRHQLDQLFSDMDPAGFMSRAPSDHGSPSSDNAQSSRTSEDNSPSFNDVVNGVSDGDYAENHGSPNPSMLRSRLTDLQERDSSLSRRSPAVSFSNSPTGGGSPAPGVVDSPESQPGSNVSQSATYFLSNLGQSRDRSVTGSRRTSDDNTAAPVRQNDYDMDNLMRVPSYGAALRTSGTVTPFTDGPPSYVEATSRPASPLQRPSQAHVRAGADSPNSQTSGNALSNNLSTLGATAHPPVLARPPRSRRSSSAVDDAVRLRMLRVGT
jgi:hypothetical protein